MVLNFTVIKKIVKRQCGGNLLSLTNYLDPSVWSQLQMKTGGNLSLQSWSTQNIFSSIVYFLPDLFIYSEFYRKKIEAINPFHGFCVTSVLSFPLFSQSLQFPYPVNHQEITQYRQSCNTPSNQSTAGSSLSAMSEDDKIPETQVDYIHLGFLNVFEN